MRRNHHRPRVHVYPSDGMAPGISSAVRGRALACTGCYLSSLELGSFMAPIFDRAAAAPSVANDLEPELFLRFLPPFMEPIGPLDEADRRAIKASEKVLVEGRPSRVNFALNRTCLSAGNECGLDRLTARNRRRHFVLPWMPLWCAEALHPRRVGRQSEPLWYSLEMDPIIGPDTRHESLQVPFLSTIRWSTEHDARGEVAPWRSAALHPEKRDLLMSFGGSLEGSPQAVALRTAVVAACKAANDPRVCTYSVGTPGDFSSDAGFEAMLERTMATKQRSIFCVEPPGHGPVRKALNDAYLCGCIPVIFVSDDPHEPALPRLDLLWPLHLGGWGSNATVQLPAARFLSGELDLVRELRAIYEGPGWSAPRPAAGGLWGAPSKAVRGMQAALAAHGHRLMYSLDGSYEGDAADLLTRGLARALASPRRCRELWPNSWRCSDAQFALEAERRARARPVASRATRRTEL